MGFWGSLWGLLVPMGSEGSYGVQSVPGGFWGGVPMGSEGSYGILGGVPCGVLRVLMGFWGSYGV